MKKKIFKMISNTTNTTQPENNEVVSQIEYLMIYELTFVTYDTLTHTCSVIRTLLISITTGVYYLMWSSVNYI